MGEAGMSDPIRLVADQLRPRPTVFDELQKLQCVEAEAMILGGLMIHNVLIDRVCELVKPEDFFEPLHGRIFEAIVSQSAIGRAPSPVTLAPLLREDPGFSELGGAGHYLAKLVGPSASAGVIGILDLSEQVAEYAKRRVLYVRTTELLETMTSSATLGQPVEKLVETVDEAMTVALDRQHATKSRRMAAAVDDALEAMDREAAGQKEPGIAIDRFTDWNKATGNMRPGDMIVLAGRPGMGKTATALAVALGSAAAGHGTLMISLEMRIDELVRRALSDLVFQYGYPPTYEQIEQGRIQPADRRALAEARQLVDAWPLILTDPPTLKIGRLAMMIRRYQRSMQARGGELRTVIIDYLGLIEPERRGREQNRTNEIGEICRIIKNVAKECGVAIVLLSQLNRQVESREDKRPQLSDLRDSGEIEAHADTVIFVYREQYYLERGEPDADDIRKRPQWEEQMGFARDRLELISAKRRRGRVGRIRSFFFGENQAVRDSDFLRGGN